MRLGKRKTLYKGYAVGTLVSISAARLYKQDLDEVSTVGVIVGSMEKPVGRGRQVYAISYDVLLSDNSIQQIAHWACVPVDMKGPKNNG